MVRRGGTLGVEISVETVVVKICCFFSGAGGGGGGGGQRLNYKRKLRLEKKKRLGI